ncbi:immunity 8 family protein [Enterobacter mori]|uniref:immunity 8 family protein n=1 Tax=Enterobacter mori TaxID=539813 RepID=UPI0021B13D4E|nr:immunity 8 family protein [Enterobacter mori]UWX93371.1 immunity 8 family protein [Enterobacter mori]
MKLKQRKLEIKHYWSPDIYDPWTWESIDNNVFYFLEMNIGMSDEDSSDLYSVAVATIEGVSSLKDKKSMLNKQYKIILIDEYSWKRVVSILNSIVSSIEIKNNIYISQELCKYFYWEYDSMK